MYSRYHNQRHGNNQVTFPLFFADQGSANPGVHLHPSSAIIWANTFIVACDHIGQWTAMSLEQSMDKKWWILRASVAKHSTEHKLVQKAECCLATSQINFILRKAITACSVSLFADQYINTNVDPHCIEHETTDPLLHSSQMIITMISSRFRLGWCVLCQERRIDNRNRTREVVL